MKGREGNGGKISYTMYSYKCSMKNVINMYIENVLIKYDQKLKHKISLNKSLKVTQLIRYRAKIHYDSFMFYVLHYASSAEKPCDLSDIQSPGI